MKTLGSLALLRGIFYSKTSSLLQKNATLTAKTQLSPTYWMHLKESEKLITD